MFINKFISVALICASAFGARASFAAENPDVESPEVVAAARARIDAEFAGSEDRVFTKAEVNAILDKYKYIDPKHVVPTDLLKDTLVYFDANKSKFPNQNYVTVVDYSRRSDQYRIFMINMGKGSVERFHTAHGVNSDPNSDGYATEFGNVINSGMSSLGFARTTDTYSGHYGLSVRLDGLSKTNSNIRVRAVVYHGWVETKEANVIQAMSHGCLTLDNSVRNGVIDKVKGGSLINFGFSKLKPKKNVVLN